MTPNGPDPSVYGQRRARVLDALDGAVLFLPGAPEVVYSNDVYYPYRPDTNIRYLSGFEEPAALLLARTGGDQDGFTLFVRPRDEAAETWTGARAGIDGAKKDYGADFAYPVEQIFEILEKRLTKAARFFFAYSRDAAVNERVFETVRKVDAARQRAGGEPLVLTEAGAILDPMRLIKQPEEVDVLRNACRTSVAAHRRVMETVRPGMHEYEVQALVEHVLRTGGCAGPAYGTIAAGGANATVLHYVRNDCRLVEGELLLLDAGGELGGYCADITRTIPVGRSYSKAQAELYDVVLAAQREAIAKISPAVTHEDVHKTALRTLVTGMIELGLLVGSAEECIESEAYKRYFMHGTGHWLGMDVHDVGSYRPNGSSRRLEPGVVVTVEPGIYVRPDADVPQRFRGIGIRTEDDVLVTADGCVVLTGDLPKERSEIEKLRAAAFQ